MDFKEKLDKFVSNYFSIKKTIKKAVKEKKVTIGSGGSSNIIILRPDFVIKVIPDTKNFLLKVKPNNDYLETEIYNKLTQNFLLANKTPHIVGLYKKYVLEDIRIALPHKCLTLDERIMTPFGKKDWITERICEVKKSVEENKIDKKATIIILENCPTTISEQVQLLLGKKQKPDEKIHKFNQFIKRVIFQFMLTLGKIQLEYPDFVHNDLFLRNVLAVNILDYEPTDYVEYNHLGKKYYLPANGIYIKLNDFGYSLNILPSNSTLENEIKNTPNNNFEIKNPLRDVYTFLFDMYDGPGFGSQSVKTVINNQIKDNKLKSALTTNFKKQIGMFFNYKQIDKIHSLNIGILDMLWNISESKILMGTVKKPNDYFKLNLFKHYTILPDNCRVVKIYY
jgi:hypothetical protein